MCVCCNIKEWFNMESIVGANFTQKMHPWGKQRSLFYPCQLFTAAYIRLSFVLNWDISGKVTFNVISLPNPIPHTNMEKQASMSSSHVYTCFAIRYDIML